MKPKTYTNKWNEEQLTKLNKIYRTASWKELLVEFPFSTKRGIGSRANQYGIKGRSKPKESYNRKYFHREDLFDKWTEESAYLLGYLEADGHILKRCSYKNSPSVGVTFCCSEKDANYLVMLKRITGYTGKTYKRIHRIKGKKYKTLAFVIRSRGWKKFLEDRFRKERIPIDIPEEMLHHYIRGYFDGDGSIYFEKQSQDYKSSMVFSSEQLAQQFREKILETNIKISNIHKKSNSDKCWYFQISTKQTRKFGQFLYENSSIYMERKHELFRRQRAKEM